MIDTPEFSFVLPCLNEELTLATCIRKCLGSAKSNGISAEIIIADNGSSDDSISIASELGCKVINVTKKGYGSALIAGIKNAKGRYIIMGDADDSYDFSEVSEFITQLRNGADLVIGNRMKGGIQKGAMPPLHRYLGNPVLSFLGRVFYRTKVGDFHCGLRGFRRDKIIDLNLKCSGMEFASEMICKAVMSKFTIVETPIKLYPDGRDRAPHLRSWRDGWRHLRFLLIHSPNWLFIWPGLFLFLLGLMGGTAIAAGPVNIGDIVLDVNSLVYFTTSLLLGLQMLSFGAFTKLFHERLYPNKSRVKFFNLLSLEKGLIIGGVLILIGLWGAFDSIASWQENQFGDLNPRTILRQVIPSATSILAGGLFVINFFTLAVIESLIDMSDT